MIGTIRKHSKWLWILIATLTIISFVYYFNPGQRMNNSSGGSSNGNLGSVYGEKITQDEFASVEREFELFYFFRYNEWPDKLSSDELERQVYLRLLLIRKAADLGIYVGDNEAATAASGILNSPELARALKINGQSIPPDVFVKEVLEPKGLTAADFENFVRDDLAIQQLVHSLGLAGALVTPQEAAAIYQRNHEEWDAQIVSFSASNYLSQVTVSPEAIAQFYTNDMADYRLPDRVQVNYVVFDVTNFFPQAEAELAKTNLNEQVEDLFRQYGTNAFADATTPDETKAKFRELLTRRQALEDARTQANAFATTVFNLEPTRAENLAVVAKQQGLTVKTTAPFDEQTGPTNFDATAEFTQDAFGLTPDEPLAGPIVGPDGVYVIALAEMLPSEIPPLADIRAQVTRDFQLHEAIARAQLVGTLFAKSLTNSLAAGKSFAVACVAAGHVPETLPPFSLSTQELPEIGGRANLNELKQAAFTAGVGHASEFVPTDDGGFVVYIESQQPVNEVQMNADLPQFLASLRREEETQAFNDWLGTEARKEFGNVPIFQQAINGAAK